MATETAPAYSPQLDGLRAVAVAAVAWSHWLPAWQFGLPLGAGVHLFFVLSGFLITRILLGLRDAPDRGGAIRRFYLRRVLRLFPAFYAVLAVAAWAGVPLVRETWAWHAAYLSNVFIAREGAWQGHVSHFWSLAVEEQFYLAWPWLVVFAPSRWLGPLIVLTILAGPISHLAAAARGLPEPFWALVPGGSADSLGVGAMVAWQRWRPTAATPVVRGTMAVVIAAAGWLALAAIERSGTMLPAWLAAWRQLLQAMVFAAMVAGGVNGFRGVAGRVLAHPLVAGLGRISYGVYLVHAFAPILAGAGLGALGLALPVSAPGRAVLYAATTVAVAAVMWRLVERPFLRLKPRP